MDEWLEILKYTIPSLIVFMVTYFILKTYMDNEYKKLLFELKKANMKTITPIRLQAYERSVLFLERINMENLVKRINNQGMKSEQLHLAIIKAISTEYEHNLSQQIYMSQDAWDAVKQAKEETVKMVHMAMAALKGKGTSMDLITAIFEQLSQRDQAPSERAMTILKKEVKHLF